MKGREIILSPSLICGDMGNLREEVQKLEDAGLHSLHVDLVDPHFSPSMPIGLDTIKSIRDASKMLFDVHIMTNLNEFFIREFLKAGVHSITFHLEQETHPEKMIQLIHEGGAKAGIALNPGTPVESLHYLAGGCEYILLMLINPGYAGGSSEKMVSYAQQKIRDCRVFLDRYNPKAKIIVDGRVGFEVIPDLVRAGAEVLVCGSRSVFRKGHTYQENVQDLQALLADV